VAVPVPAPVPGLRACWWLLARAWRLASGVWRLALATELALALLSPDFSASARSASASPHYIWHEDNDDT
jgi:hypothetical protein